MQCYKYYSISCSRFLKQHNLPTSSSSYSICCLHNSTRSHLAQVEHPILLHPRVWAAKSPPGQQPPWSSVWMASTCPRLAWLGSWLLQSTAHAWSQLLFYQESQSTAYKHWLLPEDLELLSRFAQTATCQRDHRGTHSTRVLGLRNPLRHLLGLHKPRVLLSTLRLLLTFRRSYRTD